MIRSDVCSDGVLGARRGEDRTVVVEQQTGGDEDPDGAAALEEGDAAEHPAAAFGDHHAEGGVGGVAQQLQVARQGVDAAAGGVGDESLPGFIVGSAELADLDLAAHREFPGTSLLTAFETMRKTAFVDGPRSLQAKTG